MKREICIYGAMVGCSKIGLTLTDQVLDGSRSIGGIEDMVNGKSAGIRLGAYGAVV